MFAAVGVCVVDPVVVTCVLDVPPPLHADASNGNEKGQSVYPEIVLNCALYEIVCALYTFPVFFVYYFCVRRHMCVRVCVCR